MLASFQAPTQLPITCSMETSSLIPDSLKRSEKIGPGNEARRKVGQGPESRLGYWCNAINRATIRLVSMLTMAQ